ncbi:MAG: DnaB-like helicase N-terminal domain-containing protein, partial [Victivallales bacterium]|nr:DnaB-like helicase N-terminal domain-containing protein [Victivallales bacterium]
MAGVDSGKKPARPAGLLDEDRPQPHSLETERAILAAMLKDPACCGNGAIELLGSAEVFYSHVHREIYQAICTLLTESGEVDPISLAHILNKKGVLEDIGGEVFIAELYNCIATTANFENWCQIVRDYHILRGMINVCSDSLRQCYDVDRDIKRIIDEIESRIYQVRNNNVKSEIISLRESIRDVFTNIQ